MLLILAVFCLKRVTLKLATGTSRKPHTPTDSAEAEPNKDKPNKAGIDAHPYATQHMTGNPEWSSAKSGVARALLCRDPAALPGA